MYLSSFGYELYAFELYATAFPIEEKPAAGRGAIYRAILSIIAALLLSALLFPSESQASDAALSQRIDKYLSNSVENGFSGAVLIADRGSVILSTGYGLADKEQVIPNTPQTVFDIGSLTKQFTAAAILKLVEQGKLDLQDTLGQFFSNVPEDKRAITIHQLLTHTSGMRQFSGDDYDMISVNAFLRKIFDAKLLFQPGEKFEYSNAGYSVLGLIIEQVTGGAYEAFLREHLFLPAGMNNTGYLMADWDAADIAQGYNFGTNKHWGTNLERWAEDGGVSWHLKANGGMLSTIEDMHRWIVALEAGKILPDRLRALYTTSHVDLGNGRAYAYGWRVIRTDNNKRLIAHNGSNFIFFAAVMHFPEDGRIAVFMTNEGRRDVFLMSREITRMLDQPGYQPSPLAKPNIAARLRMQIQMMGLQ